MEEEDLILKDIFKKISKGFYVDVGCYHPIHLSNTYLLYQKGWRGINIDLSEYSIELFDHTRNDDLNINAAVTNFDGKISFFYQKELSQISSVKKNTALKRMQGLIKEKKIDGYKLETILTNSKYKNKRIDFLNIDVEDGDFDALCSINFDVYRPKVICIEIDEFNILGSNIYKYLINLSYKKIWSSKSGLSHIFTDL
tara:strand:+ start:154 stop:747 length:594 start_codon:yes stop_codon:yes gene_type:complete